MDWKLGGLILAVMLGGCATPVKHMDGPMARRDKNTEYAVTDRPGGFAVEVRYARYQFIPESEAVGVACKQAAMATTYEVADKRGRKIAPINEQRIEISMGRNGLSGITSCRALVVAEFAQ